MDYAEDEAYGITQKSIDFINSNRHRIGSIVKIECLLAGNKHTDFGKEQWVALVDKDGNRIVVSGLSWGYAGEGPHSLLKVAKEFGFDLSIEDIAYYPQGEYWEANREPMKLTEELASYIVNLQDIADVERGLEEDELYLQHQLELEFPNLRVERERSEFNQWLWGTRTEAETDVVEARFLLGHHIPFDEVYQADDHPEAPESTYQLYRKHTEVAGELFQETKQAAEKRLLEQDRAGTIDLRQQWKRYQEEVK